MAFVTVRYETSYPEFNLDGDVIGNEMIVVEDTLLEGVTYNGLSVRPEDFDSRGRIIRWIR